MNSERLILSYKLIKLEKYNSLVAMFPNILKITIALALQKVKQLNCSFEDSIAMS